MRFNCGLKTLSFQPHTRTTRQDEMTSTICNVAALPAVRASPERARALLGCFHNMAELAR